MITWRDTATPFLLVNILRLVTRPISIVNNHYILLVRRRGWPVTILVGIIWITGWMGAFCENALMSNPVPAKAELMTV